jgi:hypothetical protein
MKAEEKAKELVSKMRRDNEMPYQYAKQCAVIAVDEILDLNLGCSHDENLWDEAELYERVKQEIEKL